MNQLTQTTFTTVNAHYQFIKGGILKITHAGKENEYDAIDQNFQLLKDKLSHKKHKILFDNEGFKYSGKKTRVVSLNKLDEFASALAFVAKTKTAFGMASIFAALSNAKCPIKIFRNEAEALYWLNQVA